MSPKKLLILGATGGTGRELVTQALALGHEVTAFARNPTQLTLPAGRLHIVAGSLPEDQERLIDATQGQDAVISALGRGRSFNSERLFQQSMPVILAAMESSGVRRFILTSAIGVGTAIHDTPLFSRLFARTMLRDIYADKLIGEDLVRRSDLDWTIVQPVQLTDGPLTGTYRVGEHLKHHGIPKVSRADVAHFILSQIESTTYSRKIARIGYA